MVIPKCCTKICLQRFEARNFCLSIVKLSKVCMYIYIYIYIYILKLGPIYYCWLFGCFCCSHLYRFVCTYFIFQQHNLFCDNCHSHVARALNLMQYNGSHSWNMFKLWFFVMVYGKYVR